MTPRTSAAKTPQSAQALAERARALGQSSATKHLEPTTPATKSTKGRGGTKGKVSKSVQKEVSRIIDEQLAEPEPPRSVNRGAVNFKNSGSEEESDDQGATMQTTRSVNAVATDRGSESDEVEEPEEGDESDGLGDLVTKQPSDDEGDASDSSVEFGVNLQGL